MRRGPMQTENLRREATSVELRSARQGAGSTILPKLPVPSKVLDGKPGNGGLPFFSRLLDGFMDYSESRGDTAAATLMVLRRKKSPLPEGGDNEVTRRTI